ncbi:NADPH-dependent FMN reductase [Roseivirga sp.]|uniref:NADPH-dependent FMN reductase n=1 Tax=Roseivirga sp. TaxID=1964215 RepID=UPI003B524CA3
MITIVVGTNRKDSMSAKIAQYYQTILTEYYEGPTQIVDLAHLPSDFTGTALYENNGKNSTFNEIREKVQSSEKLVFVVPEYNGSFPGVVKAFIDGLKYPEGVRDKKGALIGVSSGVQGGLIAMSHLTDIFNYLGMHVLALKPKLAGIEKNWDGEKLTNALYNTLLHQQAEKLVKF